MMAEAPLEETTYLVDCPHCRKTFEAELIPGAAPRYTGFKCPHCRLFVSYDRAEERDLLEPSG